MGILVVGQRSGWFQIIIKLKRLIERSLDENVIRWLLVGCGTIGIDWSIFVTLYSHIGSVALTNLVSITVSAVFNYTLHHRWTFNSDQRHLHSGVRYCGVLFGGFLLNTTLVKIFIIAGLSPSVAKLLAVALQAPISYLILRFFVFKHVKTV